jgi:hypothetical protein
VGVRGLFLGVKRPGQEADHSLPSSAEIKECVELYNHSPNTPAWRGAQLKAQGQLYLYLLTHFILSYKYLRATLVGPSDHSLILDLNLHTAIIIIIIIIIIMAKNIWKQYRRRIRYSLQEDSCTRNIAHNK